MTVQGTVSSGQRQPMTGDQLKIVDLEIVDDKEALNHVVQRLLETS